MQVKKGQRWPENIRTKCPGTFLLLILLMEVQVREVYKSRGKDKDIHSLIKPKWITESKTNMQMECIIAKYLCCQIWFGPVSSLNKSN